MGLSLYLQLCTHRSCIICTAPGHLAQVLHELVKRLGAYYDLLEGGMPVPEGKLTTAFEDPLPLEDFFEVGVG